MSLNRAGRLNRRAASQDDASYLSSTTVTDKHELEGWDCVLCGSLGHVGDCCGGVMCVRERGVVRRSWSRKGVSWGRTVLLSKRRWCRLTVDKEWGMLRA
jgi:hypothetical protein